MVNLRVCPQWMGEIAMLNMAAFYLLFLFFLTLEKWTKESDI